MGLPHNGENPDKSHAVFLSVRMWSCTPTRNPDPISASRFDNQDGRWGKASTAPLGVGNFRRQTSASPTTNRALSSSDLQSLQQESQRTDFQV